MIEPLVCQGLVKSVPGRVAATLKARAGPPNANYDGYLLSLLSAKKLLQ